MTDQDGWGISIINKMPVGSRVTCNPAPTDSDEDWLCYVENLDRFIEQGSSAGFVLDGSLNGGGVALNCESDNSCIAGMFASISRASDHLNLIGTSDVTFMKRFMLATHVCKALNLMTKPDRITVFQAILYGKFDR